MPVPLPERQAEFDKGEKVAMPVEGVIPGFSQGLQKMQRGGKYKLIIPAAMAYGAEEKKNPASGEVVIPANSDLVFDVELVDFKQRGRDRAAAPDAPADATAIRRQGRGGRSAAWHGRHAAALMHRWPVATRLEAGRGRC